jgi:hypothetical protein
MMRDKETSEKRCNLMLANVDNDDGDLGDAVNPTSWMLDSADSGRKIKSQD